MKPETRFTQKQILLFITYAVLLFLGLTHLPALKGLFTWLLALLEPVLFGFVIAFILNLIMGMFRRKLFGALDRSPKKAVRALCTPLCVLCTVLCVIGFILLIVFLIIPQVTTAVTTLVDKMPQSTGQLRTLIVTQLTEWKVPASIIAQVESFSFDWKKIADWVTNFMDGKLQTVVNGAVVATTSVISTATNFFLGVIIAIYILAQKRRFMFYVRSIFRLILPVKYHEKGFRILHLAKRSCANFITGQILEALIIGVLCTLGLTVCRFPYPAAIGVLTGITALIPIIGAWIGGAIGLLLVWVDSPEKAIWFLVFILVLQFAEGQFIYPKVVGDSLGLPGLVVLLAVILGTGFGGVAGIFIAVPLSAILYTLLKETIEARKFHEDDHAEETVPVLPAAAASAEENEDSLVEELVGIPEEPKPLPKKNGSTPKKKARKRK